VELSGHSRSKIGRIILHSLNQEPPPEDDLRGAKYLLYDGTYFRKEGCLINLMDAQSQKTAHVWAEGEGYNVANEWFHRLRDQGLYPLYITMDGERSVMRVIAEIWPEARIQRCLQHIQRQGMMWLRTYPKTDAGRQLRILLSTVCQIRTAQERDLFIAAFEGWLAAYETYVQSLPWNRVAAKDLKRAMGLLKNAQDDMFWFLEDPFVPKTTNLLESFYSRLKADYRRHRGLTAAHRISYLHWYCYFKNQRRINTS
jgi:transposase-like protein